MRTRPVVSPQQDYGFFGPDSVTWKVFTHPASVTVAFQRTVLTEVLEPALAASVAATGSITRRPALRYDRTLEYVATVAFGDSPSVVAAADVLMKIHRRIVGTEPISGARVRRQRPRRAAVDPAHPVALPAVHLRAPRPGAADPGGGAAVLGRVRPGGGVPDGRPGHGAARTGRRCAPTTRRSGPGSPAPRPRRSWSRGSSTPAARWSRRGRGTSAAAPRCSGSRCARAPIATLPRWLRKVAGVRQGRVQDAVVVALLRPSLGFLARRPRLLAELLRTLSPSTYPVMAPVLLGVPPVDPVVVTPEEAWAASGLPTPRQQAYNCRVTTRQEQRMKFAVLGTGMVGQTLADRLDELGHEVVLGTRDPDATAARTGEGEPGAWLAGHPSVPAATFADAAASAEVVLHAGNGSAALEILGAAGAGHLDGKVVVDVSNPLDFSQGFPPRLFVKDDDSLAEQIQRAFPGARVVKTLNTMNCSVMARPRLLPEGTTVFVSGDDAEAKATVTEMLTVVRAHRRPGPRRPQHRPRAPRCTSRSGSASTAWSGDPTSTSRWSGRRGDLDPEEFRRLGHRLVDWVADHRAGLESLPVVPGVAPGLGARPAARDAPRAAGGRRGGGAGRRSSTRSSCRAACSGSTPASSGTSPRTPPSPRSSATSPPAPSVPRGCSGRPRPQAPRSSRCCSTGSPTRSGWARPSRSPVAAAGPCRTRRPPRALVALLAALHRRTPEWRVSGVTGRERVYVSAETHSSLAKAVRVAGLGEEALRVVPFEPGTLVDERHARSPRCSPSTRPTGCCRRWCARRSAPPAPGRSTRCARSPPRHASTPCGCTSTRPGPAWLRCARSCAGVVDGVELVDSFCTDAHKWLFTAFDASFLWVRDGTALPSALAITPEYLRNAASESGEVVDYRDWQVPLGRRMRALKLWSVVHAVGLEGLRATIRRHVGLAGWLGRPGAGDRRLPAPGRAGAGADLPAADRRERAHPTTRRRSGRSRRSTPAAPPSSPTRSSTGITRSGSPSARSAPSSATSSGCGTSWCWRARAAGAGPSTAVGDRS